MSWPKYVLLALIAAEAGYVLGLVRPIQRWRRAAIFHLWDLHSIEDRRARKRRAWLVAVEMAVTHPAHSWRALMRREPDEEPVIEINMAMFRRPDNDGGAS